MAVQESGANIQKTKTKTNWCVVRPGPLRCMIFCISFDIVAELLQVGQQKEVFCNKAEVVGVTESFRLRDRYIRILRNVVSNAGSDTAIRCFIAKDVVNEVTKSRIDGLSSVGMPSMSYALELEPDAAVTARDFDLVLHNMVAVHQPDVTSKDYIRSIERHLDESDDNELNERDSHGRTALHIAVLYRNVEAVAGLLMAGADVNVGDENGKTPFTYCLDHYDVRNYECNQLFFVFLGHVHKLIEMGLHLGQENRRCYVKARARHVFNDNQLMQTYAVELDKMEDVRVGPRTSLRDVLYQGADELATSSTKRRVLEEVLTASDFYDEFPKLCALLKLQYRRGLTRRKLMQPVKAMLQRIAGTHGLPDPCTETIIRYLRDEDLIMLVELHVQLQNERQIRMLQLAGAEPLERPPAEVDAEEIQNEAHERNIQEL